MLGALFRISTSFSRNESKQKTINFFQWDMRYDPDYHCYKAFKTSSEAALTSCPAGGSGYPTIGRNIVCGIVENKSCL